MFPTTFIQIRIFSNFPSFTMFGSPNPSILYVSTDEPPITIIES